MCVCVCGSRLESGTCDVSSVFGSCLPRQVLAMSKPARLPLRECCGSALASGKPFSEPALEAAARPFRGEAAGAMAGGGWASGCSLSESALRRNRRRRQRAVAARSDGHGLV